MKKKSFKLKFFLVTAAVLVSVAVIFGVSSFFYIKSAVRQPMSQKSEKVEFRVDKGQGTREIAEKLEKEGLIKGTWAFLIYLRVGSRNSLIQAGDYVLDKKYSIVEIVDVLSQGKVATTKITIPEGLTNKQIGELFQREKIGTKEDFDKATLEDFDFDFLKNDLKGDLQGFLFPSTYFLSARPDSKEAVEKMLEEFRKKADPLIKERKEKSSLSYYQVLVLASIVEREVPKYQDKKKVAGIFLKRMELGMNLESCATIQYVLGTNKRILSQDDLNIRSPYNTYKNSGLPPAPIANPGLDSIRAVINPQKTNYLYFFSGKDGKTYFSATNEEHEEKKLKYL